MHRLRLNSNARRIVDLKRPLNIIIIDMIRKADQAVNHARILVLGV